MTRSLEAAVASAIAGSVLRPVFIGRLDIADDPVYAWTGPGLYAPTGTDDTALNDITFDPAGSFFEISDITEDQGIGGPVTLRADATDLDQDLLRQVVRDKRKWFGQSAYLWWGLLNETETAVLADPIRIKTGVMTTMNLVRSHESVYVSVTIDHDFRNSKAAPNRLVAHEQLWAGDTYANYLVKLANKPGGLKRLSSTGTGPVITLPNGMQINLPLFWGFR
jgi:hypothetical protein